MKRATLTLLPLLALTACAVGPNYQRPKLYPKTQSAFVEAQDGQLLSSRPLPAKWWELFADPTLDRLVEEAFAYNSSVTQAEANLRQARGVLAQQRAGLLPTSTVSASYTHGRVGVDNLGTAGGANVGGGGLGTGTAAGAGTGLGTGVGAGIGTGTGTGTGDGTGTNDGTGTSDGTGTGGNTGTGIAVTNARGYTYNYYQVGFDASYEVDIFGRVKRSIEAARRDVEASQAALDGVRISVAAQVAQSYADACGYAEQADVARETARLQGRTLNLTRRLLEAGRGTRRDVDQALVTVEQAEAQVPQLEAERRANIYAIAALTGRLPAEMDGTVAQCRTVPRVRTAIPVGDGASLLARRPDVRQAERQLAGDTARIGIATAALFPQVSLAGSVGLGAPKIGNLGSSAAFSYSVGPLISWSFPNLAVARAEIRQARAGADASLAAFQGTVLNALQETESALGRYSAAIGQNGSLSRAAAASSDAADISRLRFTTGRDNFLNLLVAEQNRAAARQALAQSDLTVAEQAVSLFKALGGGWENAPPTQRAEPAAAPQGVHAATGLDTGR